AATAAYTLPLPDALPSSADGETTGDLAYRASLAALNRAGLEPADVDMVVVGTTTPDLIFPNVACLLQERLGIRGGPAFGIEAARSEEHTSELQSRENLVC